MTRHPALRNHGDEVIVVDSRGNYEFRGVIVGRHVCVPTIYDIQPHGSKPLSSRVCGIPESRLRNVKPAIRLYERRQFLDDNQNINDKV